MDESVKRGHHFEIVDPTQHTQSIGRLPKDPPDLIYTRIGSDAPPLCFSNLLVLERAGVRCINSPDALLRARDKTITYTLLSAAGVPCPRTQVAGSGSTLELEFGPPWVVKLAVSTKGQGVCLAESERSLRSVVDSLKETGKGILVQEFVKESKGSDVRVVVLGGKAARAARRSSQAPDEFRSNLYLGGRAESLTLTPDMAFIAENAAAAMGLEIAGVDLLESKDGYLVVEVNGSPGLTAAPELPSLVMDYLEEQAS